MNTFQTYLFLYTLIAIAFCCCFAIFKGRSK